MHRRLAAVVGLGVCLLLVVLGLQQPKTYTASSVIYVEPMVARNLNEQGVPGFDQFRYGSFLDQQMQTIVRPDVLTAALHTLPPGMWRGPRESEQSAVARLAKALTVERTLTSYQITVQLKASDPEAAAAIVNAVTNAYLQRGREDEFKQADLREQILSEERDRVKQELAFDRKEQAALGASMGLANPADGAGNPYDADLANLRAQLSIARGARDAAAAQLESVTGPEVEHRSGLNATAEDLINTDAGLSAKKSAVSARRVVLESMMAGMTPNNPQYRQAQDEIADLDRALEARTVEVRAETERRIADKLRTDLQRTADVESKINAQLAEATAKATGAAPKLQRAAELANDIQRLNTRYTTVDEALDALQLETNGPGMAHVPLPAAAPLTPDANHRMLFFMAALPLGLVCGVASAVLARTRDHHIYRGSDLQEALGFAPIAVLPARGEVSDRVMDEYMLRLAAGVESAYRTSGAQSFVVTAVSAGSETGLLLRDLSKKLEELRLRVVILQASELLITSQETMEHQAATDGLAAGGTLPRTLQLGEGIASAKLDRMKAQHDLILIDGAPLLHSAESEYASRCADATILIAESATTQTPELAAATALLSRLRVSGVGAVLENVKLEDADEAFRSAIRVIEHRSVEGVAPAKPTRPRETLAAKEPVMQSATDPYGGAEAEGSFAEGLESASLPEAPVAPQELQPMVAVARPDAKMPEEDVMIPQMPRRTFSNLAVQPQLPAQPAGRAVATPGVPGRFDSLGEFAQSSSAATMQSVGLASTTTEELPLDAPAFQTMQLDPARVTLCAVPPLSGRVPGGSSMDLLRQPDCEVSDVDDAREVGRFVGELDTIQAVPSYTRSRIRLAFKEQEVNSKTTWFSKIFRSDPPSSLRIISDVGEEEAGSSATQALQSEEPLARLPEAAAETDPELARLLDRIKPSGENRIPPRPLAEPVVEAAPELLSEPPEPFLERRSEPRLVELEQERAPGVLATGAAIFEPAATPGMDPVVPAPLLTAAPPLPPEHQAGVYQAGAVGRDSARSAQSASGTGQPARPLRPLTFQQLAGSNEAEALDQDQDSLEFASQPLEVPARTMQRPEPVRVLSPAPQRSISAFWSPRPGGNAAASTAPIATQPPFQRPGLVSTDAQAHPGPGDATSASPSVSAQPRQSVADARLEEASGSIAPSPSARLGSVERMVNLPDPWSDPAPTQRSYRLEPVQVGLKQEEARETVAAVDSDAPTEVAAGTSFPPDREARVQMFGRRRTDYADGSQDVPGLTRRWKLLSQFEPVLTDPLPAHRKAYTRSTDVKPPRRDDEG